MASSAVLPPPPTHPPPPGRGGSQWSAPPPSILPRAVWSPSGPRPRYAVRTGWWLLKAPQASQGRRPSLSEPARLVSSADYQSSRPELFTGGALPWTAPPRHWTL